MSKKKKSDASNHVVRHGGKESFLGCSAFRKEGKP